jgi:hypothetical protein
MADAPVAETFYIATAAHSGSPTESIATVQSVATPMESTATIAERAAMAVTIRGQQRQRQEQCRYAGGDIQSYFPFKT